MSKRIHQEVEDLLNQLEKFPSRRPLNYRLRVVISSRRHLLLKAVRSLSYPSVGQIVVAGIILIIIAWVLNSSNAIINQSLIAVGAGLIILGFALSFRRKSRPTERRWRGQILDLPQPPSGRVRSWWNRRYRR